MFEPWPIDPLGNHCSVRARIGWRGLASSEYTSDGPFLIAGKHVRNGQIDWATCDHITDFRYHESMEIALTSGDVVLTKDGTIGRVARIDHLPGRATLNGTMMLLRSGNQLDYRFLFHLLTGDQFKKLIADKVSGSSIPHIFQRDMVTLPISIPPMKQQLGIADVLDTLDTTIRQTELIIEKLKQVKQGLLHDLLTRGIDANGALRPLQSQAPHLYKDSPLGWVPLEWNVVGLADLASESRVVLRTGPFGSSLKGEHFTESGRPVVTIGSLGVGKFIEKALLFVSDVTAHTLKEFELVPGDIAFSRVADVGRSVVVEVAQRGWIMSSNFMRIAVDTEKVEPHFLQTILAFDAKLKRQMRSTINSAGRDVASSAIMMSLLFSLPPKDEQLQALNRKRVFDARIEGEEVSLQKLVTLRAGLMDDLLSGRVRVTPPLDSVNG
jgi:type I restriction enzyme S subunit